MTLEQIEAQIAALAGRAVRLRPEPTEAPYVWVGSVGGSALSAAQIAASLSDWSPVAAGDQVRVRLTDEQLAAALERATLVDVPAPAPLAAGHRLILTREDRRTTTYAALADEVGAASARWALHRSSDRRQIDCATTDLATLTLANPVVPALLAAVRLRRTPQSPPPGLLAALAAQWPAVMADARRTGRTRPVALQVEQLAAQALRWTEQARGPSSPAVWTGERLTRSSRIVLLAGLAMAGIGAPSHI